MNNMRRISRQANDGLSSFIRGGRPSKDDKDDDSLDEFDEDYFQTLVTRGAARGVLTVHIKNCTDFKSLSVKVGTQSFLRVSVGEKVKCTRLQPYNNPKSNDKIAITFNEWKYFSIRIPKDGGGPMDTTQNIIMLELIFFETESGVPKLMGKSFVKLLEVLNKDRMTMHVDLKLSRQIICKLELDLVITYGTFGYGYSHQLRHPKRTMENFVDRSLFLRCPPPLERKDAHYNVLTPRPIPYLDIIGSLLSREAIGPGARHCNRIFPPKLMDQLQRRGRLLQLYETFESYDSQADVLLDLEKIIQKRGLQMSTTWRQNRKAKKSLSRWKTKASLIPKLLSFSVDNKKATAAGPSMRAALQAAARNAQRMDALQEDAEEAQPEASDAAPPAPTLRSALLAAARQAQRMEALHENVEVPTTAVAASRPEPSTGPPSPSSPKRSLSPRGVLDPPSPAPLFKPGESLLSADDVAAVSTARRTEGGQQQQQKRNEEETVLQGLKSLSLGSEKAPPGPGQAGFSGAATLGRLGAGALERPPQASSPQGAGGSMWGRLKGMDGPQKPMEEAPGPLKQPRSPSALVHPAKPTSAPGEDPTKTWLKALSSFPSLSSVISEADLEPIKSNLAFTSPTSSHPPQPIAAAASTSGSTGGGGHRSKPGRDKLKTQEGTGTGTGTPYHRPSHPR